LTEPRFAATAGVYARPACYCLLAFFAVLLTLIASAAAPLPALAQNPELNVSGTLLEAGPEELIGPDSELTLLASSTGSEFSRIDLLIDGEVDRSIDINEILADGGSQSCPEEVCELTYSFTAGVAAEAAPGLHEVGVRVSNKAEESTAVEGEVTLDTRAPSIELSGELAESDGKSLAGASAELSIDATDGSGPYDSGVGSVLVLVNGTIVKEEGYACEPSCPEPASTSYTYREEEWGEGPGEVTVVALDLGGNESSATIEVNNTPESVEPTCEALEPTSVEPEGTVTSTQAIEALEASMPGVVAPNAGASGLDPDELIDPEVVKGPVGSPPEEAFVVTGTAESGHMVDGPAGGITVAQSTCLTPLTTTSAETAPVIMPAGNGVIYVDSGPETDTIVHPTPTGIALIESLRGPAAPTSFSWQLSLGPDEELIELGSGGLAIIRPEGMDFTSTAPAGKAPEGNDPDHIGDVEIQLEAAAYDLAAANDEVEAQVVAVFAPPDAVNSEGDLEPAVIEGTKGGEVTLEVPKGSKGAILRSESAPDPVAICAQSFAADPRLYDEGCSSTQSEGIPDGIYVADADWSPSGPLVYSAWDKAGSDETWEPALYIANEDGSDPIRLGGHEFRTMRWPKVSPDGSTVAFNGCKKESPHTCGIWTIKTNGSDLSLVGENYELPNYTEKLYPSFSADGKRIYFFEIQIRYGTLPGSSLQFFETQLYSVKLNGTDIRQITDVQYPFPECEGPTCNLGLAEFSNIGAASASPDGNYIVFGAYGKILRVDSNAEMADLEELTSLGEINSEDPEHPRYAQEPVYSPDGSEISYLYYELENVEPSIYSMKSNGTEAEQVAEIGWGFGQTISLSYSSTGDEVAWAQRDGIYAAPAEGGTAAPLSNGEGSNISLGQVALEQVPEIAGVIQAAEAIEQLSYEFPGGITVNDAERRFCEKNARHLAECYYFYEDRNRAFDMRERLFTNRNLLDDSTRGNAFQHSYWTALMVRDSTTGEDESPKEEEEPPDGLQYAFIHEEAPLDRGSRMDIVNDTVGYAYLASLGVEEEKDEMELCESFRVKGGNAIFIGAHINANLWVSKHPSYQFLRLVFRKLRSGRFHANDALGPIEKPNGRTCAQTW
jgi:WD40-like Beta Propeller Repeat